MLSKKYLLIFLVLLFSLFVVKSIKYNSSEYLVKYTWVYDDGFSAGDFLKFEIDDNQNERLRMIGELRKASVVFCFYKTLVIKSSESGRIGFYFKK